MTHVIVGSTSAETESKHKQTFRANALRELQGSAHGRKKNLVPCVRSSTTRLLVNATYVKCERLDHTSPVAGVSLAHGGYNLHRATGGQKL